MRGSQVLPLVKSVVAYTVRLFSWHPSQSENAAYLSSSNPPRVPVIDNSLPHERYSEAIRQLLPPNCAFFQGAEVRIVDNSPIQAGGYADNWEAILDGRNVVLESYRSYETGDIDGTFRRYHTEILACIQLSHPNIVPFVGITSPPGHPFSLVFNTSGCIGLREYLTKNPGANRLKLIQGIARGLKHVHDLDIVHGRLCSNILVSPDGIPCITGFGSSFLVSRPDLWSDKDVVGFHRGSAPELIRPPGPGKPAVRISKASDMYAFGMLTWEIFSGEYPFSGDLDATVVRRVFRGDRPSRPGHGGVSSRVWKMVKNCWQDSPSRRMAVWEVVALLDAE